MVALYPGSFSYRKEPGYEARGCLNGEENCFQGVVQQFGQSRSV